MAAPNIPDLNILRNARGAGCGRGRGSNGLSNAGSSEEERVAKDRIVQQTDQDASISRLSAVELGYLHDPFAKYFVSGASQRRFPIINRGTYVRTKAIDNLLDKFLSANPAQRKQIISLGAGSDTRFFRLMTSQPHPTLKGHYIKPDIVYHEIDFAKNTLQKLDRIKRLSELCTHVATPWYWYNSSDPSNLVLETDTLESSQYHVHPVDLRTLVPSRSPSRSFRNIDTTLPTIIISECCLCYLNPAAADTVALYFTKHLFPDSTPVGLILYEPINPNDRFGQVMVSNLAARGIVLQTLRKYGSLEAQAARMKSYGLDRIGGADVNTLWEKGVEEKEKGRVASLEMVDEVEEWKLLAGHYCVVWGWRGDQLWDGWKDVAAQMDDER